MGTLQNCCTGSTNDKKKEENMKLLFMEQKPKSNFIIFQVGTFPWQSHNEPTSGSGILHEAHHHAINSIAGYSSYSVWPSIKQKNDESKTNNNFVRIYEVDKFPRFYAEPKYSLISESFLNEYRKNLENLMYDFMIDIETKYESQNSISLIICHHPFQNCIMISNVMKRRKENGLNIPQIAGFIHGSVLKIYQYELDENNDEYPSDFYHQMTNLKLFESNQSIVGNIDLIYSISTDVTNIFLELFPKFNADNIIYSTPGYNPIFKKLDDISLMNTLHQLKLKHIGLNQKDDSDDIKGNINITRDDGNYIGCNDDYKYMIMFAGSLAEWKRVDVLIYAANEYEKAFGNDILTLIVGRQLEPENNRLQSLNDKLKNKNVYFVGPRGQDVLIKLYNAANIGVFPAKNEPFGMVFIECLACGTPVIGANSGGPVDFIDDIVGKLIDENDDNQILGGNFANAIIDSIQNDHKVKKSINCVKVAEPYAIKAKMEMMLRNTKQMCVL
eukprot:492645_1